MQRCKVVLLDVEGTVAPISFVYDVMFPYARDHLERFVRESWNDAVELLPLFREQAALDKAEGVLGGIGFPEDEAPESSLQDAMIRSALWQMESDRKTTALKALQGKIWKGGFESRQLKSRLFADVPRALAAWNSRGIRCAIYSSGSVQAQKLFFKYAELGDFSQQIVAHFDTQIGPKREESSYTRIAEQLGVAPEEVWFATDVVAEADAARAAGMQTVVMVRPGNPEQPCHSHPVRLDFEGIAE